MANVYYEVVFEGHYRAINGLLEGFRLGSGKDWNFFFSEDAGVQAETLTEIILEWITLKTKLHHVIMEEDFYKAFEKGVASVKDSQFVSKKYIKSATKIKEASMKFEAKTYGQKYGNEIKSIMNNLPDDLVMHDYNPIEKQRDEAKGPEMYAPEHDYIFEAKGRITGPVENLAAFRKKLDDHPLIAVKEIKLTLK